MTPGSLEGKVAIVTGSTGEGMGRQIAWTLAREGASVVLNYGTYRQAKGRADRTVAECLKLGAPGAIAVRADTRKEAEVKRLAKRAERSFGTVDIAVANAGGDWLDRPLEKLTQAEWRKVVDAEVDGALQLARHVAPGMKRKKAGRIVLIGWDAASQWTKEPFDYAFGKAAREILNRQLSRDLERHGVMVNMVNPGYIPYPKDKESKEYVRHGKGWEKRERATNQDVAEAVLWLCSDGARFVSGSEVRVFGPSEK